jgi:MraZ protein
MFYGQHRHTIDSKGRVTIPARFRDVLRENYVDKFFVTIGLDHCLWVFTPREWNQLVAKLREQSIVREGARHFVRLVLANASEVECDKQGRIMIPPNLLRYAGIQKDVVVAGLSNRLEIWDEGSWRKFEAEKGNVFEEIAEGLIGTGL